MHLSRFRHVVERGAPTLATAYRRARDSWTAARASRYVTVHGFTLVGDADLDTSRADSHETSLFVREVAHAAAVVDIGANAGLFTLLAAQLGRPVVAVEPHPLNIRHLLRNVRDNDARGIEVYPVALSAEPGVLALRGGGQGASFERSWGGMRATYETLVPVTTLDRLIEGWFGGEHLFIKVDVEGHEHAVLRGAAQTLGRVPRPVWLVEHGLTENFGGGVNPHYRAVFDAFWRAGYKAYAAEGPTREIDAAQVDEAVTSAVRPWPGVNVLFR